MDASVKSAIFARLVANLQGLKDQQVFASISRELDPVKSSQTMPSLCIYDGPEIEIGRDNRGRTYEFPLTLRILLESATSLAELKDKLVPEVQVILELDPQLNGLPNLDGPALAIVVDGGVETPLLNELNSPVGGAWLEYTVQYRRQRGDPTITY